MTNKRYNSERKNLLAPVFLNCFVDHTGNKRIRANNLKKGADSILVKAQLLFINICVCSDDIIPHTGLSLYIHSFEVIIFNFCPYWPVGRWLAWIPFLSGHQIWPDCYQMGLITKLAAALQTCSFLFLSLGTADCMHWIWTSAKHGQFCHFHSVFFFWPSSTRQHS